MSSSPDRHEYCTGGFRPDDIVISGVAGRFPHCDSLGELCQALYEQRNLMEQNSERYEKGAANLTFSSSGTLNHIDKFDAEFFGFTSVQTDWTDPAQRILLEVSYEAMADSGYDPSCDLKSTKIGVYSAITNQDAREIIVLSEEYHSAFATGFLRCMFANRCSHIFDFYGPSYTVDAACSSSLVALCNGIQDLRDGKVDAALVNAAQLCLSPQVTQFYNQSGIVSATATSDPFDFKANGIVRTEAVTALFLQRASVARRAYASIMSINHIAAGYVAEGVYVPSEVKETENFLYVLKEAGLTADNIDYIEAHGTGTPVGDPIEVKAIEKVFCKTKRSKPLYIGSVKSNVGHSEAAAGSTGTMKAILAFETGVIAPNFGFEAPNPKCDALVNGTIQVVTKPIPVTSPYIPISSLGFGGSIVHTILKRNPITYSENSKKSNLSRLVLYPATTEAAIQSVFDYIEDHPQLTDEFFALLNKLSFTPTLQKPYRGYALYHNENPVMHITNSLRQKREVWFVLTGMGCQWPGMGLEMMKIEVFAESMKKSAEVLKPLGLDLFELLKKDTKHLLTDRVITPAFVTIAAIQIALIDLLRVLEIVPDGIIGHSTGELLCAYADGCCTAEQTILSAYWRGKSVESVELPDGAMAAVGLTWEEAARRCPKDVFPACHNADDSVTISGLRGAVKEFVSQLQKENIFARVVNAYGYAFHCPYIWPAANALRSSLSKIITKTQPRTNRWISTSYPEEEWENEECRMAGPEYFVHNLMSTVRFSEILKKIPHDAITIEIGPHFLLQALLKRSLGSDATYIGLMKRNIDNNEAFFLESLGQLYVEGLNPKIENLYPAVKFPVPRGTPIISNLIKWNHSRSYVSRKWKPLTTSYIHRFHLEAADSYLLDHFIDGRSLFPATGYVFLAWQALAKKHEKEPDEMNIAIEDFKIHRATIISPSAISTFNITILDATGRFEIMEGTYLVATGNVIEVEDNKFSKPSPVISNTDTSMFVSGEEIYNELKIVGYEYGPAFRRLVEVDLNGTEGYVEFNDWISFLDSLLLFYMFTENRKGFFLPTGALSFKISPNILKSSVEECLNKNQPGVPVNFHASSRVCRSMGVEIRRLEVDVAPKNPGSDACILEEYKFVPYTHGYKPSNAENRLEKYMVACNKVIEKIEKRLKIDLSRGKFSDQNCIDFDVDSYINDFADNHKILLALEQFADREYKNDTFESNVLFTSFVEDIGKDILNTLLVDEYCLRFVFDIISENSFRKLSILEVNKDFDIVLPKVVEVVEKFSMVKFSNKILVCNNDADIDKNVINECNIQLMSYDDIASTVKDSCHSVVISSCCTIAEKEVQNHVRLLSSTVEQRGFILMFHKSVLLPPESLIANLTKRKTIGLISESTLEKIFETQDLEIISKISDNFGGNLYLLRRSVEGEARKLIRMSENSKWFDELKLSIVESSETTWIVSEDSPNSGLIGMVNCLRHEPGGVGLRCVFIPERSKSKTIPPFSLSDPFYKTVLKKDLVMNVYKDGAWGSFRHVKIEKEMQTPEVDYSFVTIKKCGDLSSVQWEESAVKYIDIPEEYFGHNYYAPLNFRDVMLATGKISVETAKAVAGTDNCVLGFEFSGRHKNGQRVAGVCRSGGIATASQLNPQLHFIVPDEWSLEDAATVPVVYSTCYYALMIRGRLLPGEKILIHSGTGGIGLAAINIALNRNCEIFTTVGTQEKRQYLLKTFPQLNPKNIGNSRDTSFEDMIMERTNGQGVDLVLNSLADEKFYASVRCVAMHGRFIEIGKYDLSLDHTLGLKCLLKNISIHGVFLDQLMDDSPYAQRTLNKLSEMLRNGVKTGEIKPLHRTVFQRHEVEKAFRYMGGGTHIGKVIVKIRDEEKDKLAIPTLLRLKAEPYTYFYPEKVYIVIGGLGGFGIEVSKWLLSKGARNLVLTSRYGARTPYHHLCLKRWRNSGFNVVVSTEDVSNKKEAMTLLKEVSHIGPVGGIFNSAVVLHDAFLENMNFDHFKEVCAPKADATLNLDALSRCLCPQLDHFVCFSSISCGRGNAGQMNYGYANSVMERVCEERRAAGLPGLAIQWGIIGEVGVVHRHMGDDAMILGVGAQKVKSCLKILNLTCQLQRPVVCSYVIKDSSRKKGDQGNVLQQLARIFGLKDPSEFNALRSFGEMGVDSMIGIEIKHLLETMCDITLTMKEIRELKINDIKAYLEKLETHKKESTITLVSTASIRIPKTFVHPQPVEALNAVQSGSPVFILDLDCSDLLQLRLFGDTIKHPVYALLWSKDTPTSNVESVASWYLQKMKEITQKEANILVLSSASILAFEMALQSQKLGSGVKSLTVLNGSSSLMKIASNDIREKTSETDILCEFAESYLPAVRNKLKDQLAKSTFDHDVRLVIDLFVKSSSEAVNKSQLSELITSHVKKTYLMENYKPELKLLKDLLVLEDSTSLLANDVAEVKMLLTQICSGKITIQRIPGIDVYTEDSVRRIVQALDSVF